MPTDALLIERIEYPAAPYGYYAVIFDEDGKALKNAPVPHTLAAYTAATHAQFVHSMPGDAEQPWRFWIKLLCANMQLPNNSYGCHYTILIFARAAAGVENPAVDTLKQIRELVWIKASIDFTL